MKIVNSGYSNLQYPQSISPSQNSQARPLPSQKEGQVSGIQRQTEAQTESLRKSGKSGFSSSLSKYLNPEEKEMLGQLFPSARAAFGIQAYQRDSQPMLQAGIRIGQALDVST